MTDTEFLDRAEALFRSLERQCDHINDTSDADLDSQRVGGMLTITFPNASQVVINWQKPLHEVWLASRFGGYHFRFDGTNWQDTKGQGEFYALLARDANAQSGLQLPWS